MEKESIALVRLGESKEYASIDELLRDQNLDILYPTALPEGIFIESVYVFESENGGESISFFTESVDTAITVDTCASIRPEDYIDCEIYHTGGRDFYLLEEAGYFAVCYNNHYLYTIRSTSRENIILIIENMKELGQ